MWKRAVITLGLTLLPFAVSAESAITPDPAAAATLQQQPSGPAAAGSSTAASASLQPAGNSPLQSDTSSSNGLGAASANQLQAPALSSDQLRVWLGSETDGPSTERALPESQEESPLSTWIGLGLGLLALGFGLFWLRSQPVRRPAAATSNSATAPETTTHTDDSDDVAEPADSADSHSAT